MFFRYIIRRYPCLKEEEAQDVRVGRATIFTGRRGAEGAYCLVEFKRYESYRISNGGLCAKGLFFCRRILPFLSVFEHVSAGPRGCGVFVIFVFNFRYFRDQRLLFAQATPNDPSVGVSGLTAGVKGEGVVSFHVEGHRIGSFFLLRALSGIVFGALPALFLAINSRRATVFFLVLFRSRLYLTRSTRRWHCFSFGDIVAGRPGIFFRRDQGKVLSFLSN